jgi:hypothetical protein
VPLLRKVVSIGDSPEITVWVLKKEMGKKGMSVILETDCLSDLTNLHHC